MSAHGYIRAHKSFIVNIRFIFSVERNNIILTDNSSLAVSRAKTEEIKQAKGELLITIMSSLAQEENRSISENITWGQLKSFADGKTHLAYKHFHGYEKGEGGRPAVAEEEAAVVRLIYKLKPRQEFADILRV